MILRAQHSVYQEDISYEVQKIITSALTSTKRPVGRPSTLPNQEILTTSKTWDLISPSSNTIYVKLKTLIFV